MNLPWYIYISVHGAIDFSEIGAGIYFAMRFRLRTLEQNVLLGSTYWMTSNLSHHSRQHTAMASSVVIVM